MERRVYKQRARMASREQLERWSIEASLERDKYRAALEEIVAREKDGIGWFRIAREALRP